MAFRFGKINLMKTKANSTLKKADEVITQNKKIVTNLRFIYSLLTNGDDPKDVMAEDEMDEDDEENLAEMWNMDEEITDSSDDEQD